MERNLVCAALKSLGTAKVSLILSRRDYILGPLGVVWHFIRHLPDIVSDESYQLSLLGWSHSSIRH